MDLLAPWFCWMTLPFPAFIIYQERQKPGFLCTGLFDFIDVFWALVACDAFCRSSGNRYSIDYYAPHPSGYGPQDDEQRSPAKMKSSCQR